METLRLQTIQMPAGTLSLLESFAATVMRDAADVRVVKRMADLPAQFLRHVGGGAHQHFVWYAWYEDDRLRMVTGAMSMERSREIGRPVLEIRIFDGDGFLDESGHWVRTTANRWVQCTW